MTVLDTPTGAIGRLRIPALPRLAVVLAGFSILTVFFFWPWFAHLSSALIGPPEDNMQDFWNSWHAAKAQGWKDFLFSRQIRFPEGTPSPIILLPGRRLPRSRFCRGCSAATSPTS